MRHRSGQSVLVVEDRADIREVLQRSLNSVGVHHVREASTCAQALTAARTSTPTVIILDNGLPDGTGLDLLPALREACPAARIVVFSADPLIAADAIARGADGFADKMRPLQDLLDLLWPAGAPTDAPGGG